MRQPNSRLVVHLSVPPPGTCRALGSRRNTYKLVPSPSKIFSNKAKLVLLPFPRRLKSEVAFLAGGVLIVNLVQPSMTASSGTQHNGTSPCGRNSHWKRRAFIVNNDRQMVYSSGGVTRRGPDRVARPS